LGNIRYCVGVAVEDEEEDEEDDELVVLAVLSVDSTEVISLFPASPS
jgi:hypothetical protein